MKEYKLKKSLSYISISFMVLFLAACSNSSSKNPVADPVNPTYQLQGTAFGLTGNVSIDDGNGNIKILTTDGSFSFSPVTYLSGDSYDVVVTSKPADSGCRVVNGKNQFTNADKSNLEIRCQVQQAITSNLCALPPAEMGAVFNLVNTSVAYGAGLGASGFSRFDTDGDGYKELMFGTGYGFGPNSSFIIIEYDAALGSYQSICQSKEYDSNIQKISSFSNQTITNASLVILGNGDIEIINHAQGIVAATINSGITNINDLLIGDIDNDGQEEILLLTDSTIYIYNSDTFASEGTLPSGGKSFALGFFTKNTLYQLAINTGLVIEIEAGVTTVIWDYQVLGFGNTFLTAGDIDSDGLDEIVAGDRWYNFKAFNVDTKGIQWSYSTNLDIDTLEVIDTDGDSIPEVIYSDGQFGSTYVLNGSDAMLITSFPNKKTGVTNVLVDDLDQDSNLELIWGSGYGSTGADYLSIVDLALSQTDWTSPPDENHSYAVAYEDITGDGEPDRLYASLDSESGYSDGIVTAVNGVTGEVLWRTATNTFGSNAWTGIHALAVADINNDGIVEVLVGTDRLYDGRVYALDSSNGQVISFVALESGSPIYSLKVADIDGDGNLEILAGGGMEHTGAIGVFIYVIDPVTFTWESSLPSLGKNWNDLWVMEVVDWDSDQNLDVLTLWYGAYVIDPEINAVNRTVKQNYTAMAVFGQDVYLATDLGTVELLNTDTTTTSIGTLCNSSILSLESINSDELAFTCNGRLGIFKISTATVNWQTGVLDVNIGLHDSLKYTSVEGVSRLLVGGKVSYNFSY